MIPWTSRASFRVLAVLAATTMVATLAACSSTATPPKAGDDSSATSVAGGDSATSVAGGDSATPVAGGTLRVGIVGGSAKDSLDAHGPITHPDEARAIQLYDTLATYDTTNKLVMDLADTMTPSADAKTWTIHLRDGVKFSNGDAITAKDVIFTLDRITDPKNPQAGATGLKGLDREAMTAKDGQTVIVSFQQPVATFPDIVAQYNMGIVPVGYDPKNPVSSGPFMMGDFTPGQQSTFVKNPYYWRPGQPLLDKVTIIDFPDDTARVNALLGGQVDAIDQLPLGQVNVVAANPQLKVLESKTGSWLPFTMRVDKPPFNNEKVRQAFRLIVDRKQMVEQVLGGHGTIGNDMYSPLDRCFPTGISQRTQDIAQAKKLLAEAGESNMSIDLMTSPVAAGLVEAAQVFAQQAKAAGVTVNVKKVDPGVFYGDQYTKWVFAQDFYYTHDYLSQTIQSGFSTSPYNETHWNDPEWTALVNEANSTTDETARCALIKKAQAIEFDRGGYIIWGFPNSVDAYSIKVHGFVPDKSGIPLTYFGFRSVWIDQ